MTTEEIIAAAKWVCDNVDVADGKVTFAERFYLYPGEDSADVAKEELVAIDTELARFGLTTANVQTGTGIVTGEIIEIVHRRPITDLGEK